MALTTSLAGRESAGRFRLDEKKLVIVDAEAFSLRGHLRYVTAVTVDVGRQVLFVEPGARLAGIMLDAGVVDRIYWIQAPILLGRGAPAFGESAATPLAEAPRWVPTERKSLGDSNLLVVDRELCLLE